MIEMKSELLEKIAGTGRTFWTTVTGFLRDRKQEELLRFDYEYRQVRLEDALVVSSLCYNGMHAPVLDIDFAAQLVPSTTDGHFHLYFDKKMSWEQYKRLLHALFEAGIIQKGFLDMSLHRGQSMTLLPGIDRNKVTKGTRHSS